MTATPKPPPDDVGQLAEPLVAGTTHERLNRLLEAVRSVGSELDLPVVLRHIVEAAVTLVEAGYGALGVIDEVGQGLSEFITVGVDAATIARIGPPPTGRGVLGELVRTPTPLRLKDLAHHPASIGFPPNHPPMRTFLGVPVRVGSTVFGNLYLTNKARDEEFTPADKEVLIFLAGAAGVAIHNARLYEQSRRSSAWREAGRAVSTALLSGMEREDVIALMVESARGVVSADAVLLALRSPQGLTVAASSGAVAPAQDGQLLESLSQVLLDAEPCLAESTGLSGFAVPLGPVGSSCEGVLVALWSTAPNPLLIDDLHGFASQAAVALELADRRNDAERGALLADRDRIGRDLHDLVIQRLFATGMRLQGAVRLIVEHPVEAAARVDLAVDDLDATIRELRSTIYGLQTPVDARPSLRARLLEVLDAASEQLGFAPAMRLDGLLDTAATPDVAEHVLATVREALSNVARHAKASRVELLVSARDHTLKVVVEDDGIGLAADVSRSGLRNLSRRAEELGGLLEVGAGGTLGGTRLSWQVPI